MARTRTWTAWACAATMIAALAADSGNAALVAWWNLADGSGTSAIDSSPSPLGGSANGGNLTNFANPGANWNTGLSGATDGVTMTHGLRFDGGANNTASTFIDVSSIAADAPSLSAGTISAWFRREIDGAGISADDHSIIGFGRPEDLSYFRIHIENANANAPEFRITERLVDTVGGTDVTTEMTAPYNDDGNWHHVAFTSDGAAGILYVDGVRVASRDMPFVDFTTFSEAALGMTPRNNGDLWFFNGTLGDIRIYDQVLTGDPGVDGGHTSIGSQLSYLANPANYGDGLAPNQSTAELVIDRATGAITIQNNGVNLTNVVGYSIKSAADTLKPSQWLSITDNYDAGNPGASQVDPDNDWTELTGADSRSDLSESEFEGAGGGANGADFLNGKTTNLGNAWIRYFVEDVEMQVLFDDGSVGSLNVRFTGNGDQAFQFGDLNFDGTFNADDFYDVFVPNFEANTSALIGLPERYQVGDLDGNGLVELEDFIVLNNAYLAANPGAAPLSMSVPEPASAALLTIAALGLAVTSSRKLRGAGSRIVGAMVALACVCILGAWDARGAIVAHWAFDETAGATTLVDSVAGLNGEAASSNGTALLPQAGAAGQIGGAWQFADPASSSGGYIDLTPHLASFSGLTQGTISAWFRTTNPASANALISAYDSTVGSTEGRVIVETNGVMAWDVRDEGGNPTGEGGNVAVGAVNNGAWRHFVVTVDSDSNAVAYLDGAQISSAQEPFWGNIGNLNGMAIGRNVDLQTAGTGGQWFWEGAIDDLQIYNEPLSPQAVAAIYAAGQAGQSLVITPDTPFTLGLRVNPSSGMVELRNDTVFPITLDSYRILSTAGALTGAAWNSLEAQDYEGGGAMSGWAELADGDNQLAEAFFGDSSTLAPGTVINLGTAFDGGAQDLVFQYHLAGVGVELVTGIVEYSATGPMPDLNMDGKVDIFDVAIVSNNWANTGAPGTVAGDANKDGVVDIFDVALISNNWNPGGATAVPEPSTAALGMLVAACGLFWRRRRAVACVAMMLGALATVSTARADVFYDREYLLGDDVAESGSDNATIGAFTGGLTYDSAGTPGTNTLHDLIVTGAPTYTDVTGRPFLGGGGLGARLTGADSLRGLRFNAPHQIWDSEDINANSPPNPFFPNNYEGILNRGFDLWVKPDPAKQGMGARQDIVLDTLEHGLYITAADTWGIVFDDASVDTGVAVDFGQWTHVMHRTVAGRTGAALYVNGVVVGVSAGAYDLTSTALLTVGSNLAQDGNFYQGDLDDLRLFLWGDNSNAAVGAQGQAGQLWGDLLLDEDNAWIAGTLAQLGVTDPTDANLDGVVNDSDIATLKAGWLSENVVNGVVVGDWTSRQNGDLNYDGRTDLDDAYLLHNALLAAGGAGINFAELTAVPEPGALALVGLGLLGVVLASRKRSWRPCRPSGNKSND